MDSLRIMSRLLKRLEIALAQLAALAMFLIMLTVVTDVVMRYFLSKPLIFSYDLISMYLVVVVFFFALPDRLHRHRHIAIDFLSALPVAAPSLLPARPSPMPPTQS